MSSIITFFLAADDEAAAGLPSWHGTPTRSWTMAAPCPAVACAF
ncbi:MAG TPA: hypothetical protein VMC03_10645 [Streptosporangiaceae bacterium]|nr:hypothetical protein [Streptosporangiaceae bacterium]